ncbi:putative mediator of RNA polymerase II transcription subunit 9 [[Candida] railenensis]|uniref:Mediator of RNA polymerase II transcription subunit 9 n=1 Tax=[Candida] railenensis TaxID=45579 RepID=A0A9P0VZK0_9ASCO|nr:putative mediator of RNA polymerase II transcription subunit 9 [[Candida] railenensis]
MDEADTQSPISFQSDKLQNIELLRELLNLLHDLQSGKNSVKDFDNHAGSIRLKLSTIKLQLSQIENINQSLEQRELEIKKLEENNKRKVEFLKGLKNFTRYDEIKDEVMAE